jgi:membrane protein involved in colicin uptake
MNRSILIVICDFLLVSLLAFSNVDINKASDGSAEQTVKVDIATNQVLESGKDLTAVMRMALDEERKNRDVLLGELAKSRDASSRQQALLGEREKQVQTVQQELKAKEQEAARLQQQQASLQEQQAALQQQVSAAQTNIQSLSQQLQSSSVDASISKEKLAAMEAEARKKAEQAAALQQQLGFLAKSNQVALAEKQQLSNQLLVAETEKRSAAEIAARMGEQVKAEREEKAKLAEGFKALASKSTELTQELRENRPLAANTIFNEIVTNRVQARFYASRSGLFGNEATKRKETDTVLVSDGTNNFALCHVQDTPLTFWIPGIDWESLTGTLSRDAAMVPVQRVTFSIVDPRIVLIPLSQAQARQLGCKVYHVSSDPFKFQDAVLVGPREGYYGECKFQIDISTPDYVKMDHNSFKGLFGKFNPSRGDLVLSKTGELLGVMANSTYCMILKNFNTTATFQCGPDIREQHTGLALARLYSFVAELPVKLQ